MDETKLGDAIGEAMVAANTKMMPEFIAAMTSAVQSAQTGVYVEVPSAEMAIQLTKRAGFLRRRAEEIASAPSEVPETPRISDLPPYLRVQVARQQGLCDESSDAAVQEGMRAQRDLMVKREQENRKMRIEALRVDAERLDFMASHLPKDQVLKLDRHELDDLLFGDRRLGVGVTTAGIY
jgi:hypothetical protein